MGSAAGRKLTKRQLAVLERIDRRVPIKVIALELGVSETRINQHIRALKDIYQVDSLNELVECYRFEFGIDTDEGVGEFAGLEQTFSESAYRKSQLAGAAGYANSSPRVDHGELLMSDVMPLIEQAPWLRSSEPKVVPGVLDGEHAVLFRLVAIVGIAFGVLSAVVLTVTAAVALSEAMDGKAVIVPESESQLST